MKERKSGGVNKRREKVEEAKQKNKTGARSFLFLPTAFATFVLRMRRRRQLWTFFLPSIFPGHEEGRRMMVMVQNLEEEEEEESGVGFNDNNISKNRLTHK